MDTGFSGKAERNYEAQNVSSKTSNVKFSYSVKESVDSEFLILCTNCSNCFGCIGLKNASYCIFNKQYEPAEYYRMLDDVKTRMLENGEYGEFFPMSFAPCAYNSSMANIIYPMTAEEAKKRGLFWQPDSKIDTISIKTIKASELPDNIKDVDNNICDLAVIGEISGKPFRFITRGIDFYKRHNLALPVDTPYERMLARFKILDNFKIYQEKCFVCDKSIESSHRESNGYKPYCESCFSKEVL